MIRAGLAGGALLVLAAAFAACGGDDSTASATPTGPDDAKAKALLLTVADFPTGWAETPKKASSTPAEFKKCDEIRTPGLTGRAETGNFSRNGSASLDESLALFDSAEHAKASVAVLKDRADCFVKAINGASISNEGVKFSNASASALSFPNTGDASAGYRVKIHGEDTSKKVGADVYLDLVNVAKGNAAFALDGSDVFSPFSSDDLQTYAKKALAKLP